jgi:hypothetical protein
MPRLDDLDAAVGAGLDALDTPAGTGGGHGRGSRARRLVPTVLPPAAFLVLVIAVWQGLRAAALWPAYQLPAQRTMSDMPTAIVLILLVGIGIELLAFRPAERSVLRARGLSGAH